MDNEIKKKMRTDTQAMRIIHQILNNDEVWNMDTIEHIAAIVLETGRKIEGYTPNPLHIDSAYSGGDNG